MTASPSFKPGDNVRRNPEAGWVFGTIIACHTPNFAFKGYTHHTSPDKLPHGIKIDKSDHIAAHKASALYLRLSPHVDGPRASTGIREIGHSNREFSDFLDLLNAAQVVRVINVRKMLRSHANHQFNEATLPDTLTQEGIGYEYLAALSGLLGKPQACLPATIEIDPMLAVYALSKPFVHGLQQLLTKGSKERECAQRLSGGYATGASSADYLIANGYSVMYIMGRVTLKKRG